MYAYIYSLDEMVREEITRFEAEAVTLEEAWRVQGSQSQRCSHLYSQSSSELTFENFPRVQSIHPHRNSQKS